MFIIPISMKDMIGTQTLSNTF